MAPKQLSKSDRTYLIWFFCFFGALLAVGAVGMGLPVKGDRFADYLAYILPMVAAVVGGLGIYFESAVRKCFWWSASLLSVGLLFYLVSKHVPSSIIRVGAPFVAIALCTGLAIESRFQRKAMLKAGRETEMDERGMTAAIFIGIPFFVVFSALITIFLALDQKAHDCEITIAAPTKASITIKPQSKLSAKATSGGISRELDLGEGSVITVSPCSIE